VQFKRSRPLAATTSSDNDRTPKFPEASWFGSTVWVDLRQLRVGSGNVKGRAFVQPWLA
jgi:hypothetical protein